MDLVACFGYGSLVNRHSLRTDVVAIAPARLSGWRRHWQARPSGFADVDNCEIALLSVHQEETSQIDGVILIDRLENLPALDERERNYQRVALSPEALCLVGKIEMIGKDTISPSKLDGVLEHAFIYRGNAPAEGEIQPKLLQSYLDVVLSGFAQQHGEAAMQRFIDSTVGFEREMIADRKNSIYPRAVCLDEARYRVHDELLRRAGVRVAGG